MPTTTAATVAIFSAIYKTIGGDIGGDVSILTKNLIEGGNKPLADWIAQKLTDLGAKKTAYAAMAKSVTVFDIAGLCWAEYISMLPSQEIQLAFPKSDKMISKLLDATWFANAILGSVDAAQSVADIEADASMHNLSVESTLDNLTAQIIDNVMETGIEELPDTHMTQFVRSGCEYVVKRIPGALESAPGVGDAIRNNWIKRTVAMTMSLRDTLVPDAATVEQAISLYRSNIQRIVQSEDVFGREVGNDGLARMPLKEVYVEPDGLRIDTKTMGPIKTQVMSALNAGVKFIVISAPFGFGKTLTCRGLVAELSGTEAPIPLYIKCPNVMRVGSLEDGIVKEVGRAVGVRFEVAAELFRTRKWTVILDGFDEVAASQENMRAHFRDARSLAAHANVSIVLTSRPNGFERSWLGNCPVIEIQNFNDEQIQKWLDQASVYIPQINELSLGDLKRKIPNEVIRTPILLLLTVYSGAAHRSQKLSNTEIYELFFRKIAHGKWQDIQEPHGKINQSVSRLGEEKFEFGLAIVAWHTLGRSNFTRENLWTALKVHFSTVGAPEMDDMLTSIALAMLKSPSAEHRDEYTFTHKSFQEFLAARYVFTISDQPPASAGYRTPLWRCLCTLHPFDPAQAEVFNHLVDMLNRTPDKCASVADFCERNAIELWTDEVIFIEPDGSTDFRRAISKTEWAVFTNFQREVSSRLRGSIVALLSRLRNFPEGSEHALIGSRRGDVVEGHLLVTPTVYASADLEFRQGVSLKTGRIRIFVYGSPAAVDEVIIVSQAQKWALSYSSSSAGYGVSEELEPEDFLAGQPFTDHYDFIIEQGKQMIEDGFRMPRSIHWLVRTEGQLRAIRPLEVSDLSSSSSLADLLLGLLWDYCYLDADTSAWDLEALDTLTRTTSGFRLIYDLIMNYGDVRAIVAAVREVIDAAESAAEVG